MKQGLPTVKIHQNHLKLDHEQSATFTQVKTLKTNTIAIHQPATKDPEISATFTQQYFATNAIHYAHC